MTNLLRRSSNQLIITGVIAIVFGLIASIFPIGTAVTLVLIWGAYALVDGVLALITAFRLEGRPARAVLIAVGVIGIVAGLMALLRPVDSAVALAWALGVWLIVRAIFELASAFADQPRGPRWLIALTGALWLLAGILMVAFPGQAAVTIAVWLGMIAIGCGILGILAGLALRSRAAQVSDASLG